MSESDVSKEEAEQKFDDFRKTKALLPCQYLPSAYFYRRYWIWSSPTDVDDIRVVKNVCDTCPLKEECREVGKDEPYGIWGNEYREHWAERRDLDVDREPYA
jgi:MoaA/NifB/PqqE/SkfB family radical SAM enzyme